MKNYTQYADAVINEINQSIHAVDSTGVEMLVDKIIHAPRVFCDGLGRSGLQSGAFAVRLKQLGKEVYIVSELTTPAIGQGDLLIICSGSGETECLVAHAGKAKSFDADVVLITASENSSADSFSQLNILIPADTKLRHGESSLQPLGNLFEQSLAIVLDIVAMLIAQKLDVSNDDMYLRHKNLE